MRILGICFLALALVGCGGGGGGGAGSGAAGQGPGLQPTGDVVIDALRAAGIDTTETPRVDDDGDPLPDDFAPLGSACTINPFSELFLVNLPLTSGSTSNATTLELDPITNTYSVDVLNQPTNASVPWTVPSAYKRAATCGDIDGDGLEETCIVYFENNGDRILLRTDDDSENGFAVEDDILVRLVDTTGPNVTGLSLEAGDFNGDGLADLAVGITFQGGAEIVILTSTGSGFAPPGPTIPLAPSLAGSGLTLTMATGNLDFDRSHELAVVLNESIFSGSRDGSCRYHIYDDGLRGFAEIAAAPMTVQDAAGQTRIAEVADVSLGDVDGDGTDEVVFGGHSELLNDLGRGGNPPLNHLVFVLDDFKRDFVPLAVHYFPYDNPNSTRDSASGVGNRLQFMHVNTPDIDGDGAAEIQANQYIFASLRDSGSVLTQRFMIPFDQFIFEDNTSQHHFHLGTTAVAVADVTSDKRDDVITYSQGSDSSAVNVWGIDFTGAFTLLASVPVPHTPPTNSRFPIIVPVNLDMDSLALEFSDGSYSFVFTQPVVIAALAAAPCTTGLGQNPDSCRTAYGTATSTTVTNETSKSLSAGVSVGFSSSFSFLGAEVGSFEATTSLQTTVTNTLSRAYTLTKRVTWTTGPIEDTVIFTSVPYDQWTYRILSHPNPALVGGEVVVSIPREPLQTQVTREFYNANVAAGGPLIDASVFEHTRGQPATYPTVARKNQLIAGGGFDSDQVSVGQGAGAAEVEISVFNETGSATAYGAEFSFDLQASAFGVVAGFSVGTSSSSSVSIANGSESIYRGTISNIDGAFFPGSVYGFGLFTYIHTDARTGQQFEVLNYWVAP